MKITNKYNLPESIVRAVQWDLHPRAGFSVTDLLKPPRMLQLTRRHWDELEEDAINRLWALWGKAVHYVLMMSLMNAEGRPEGTIMEKRVKADIKGITVSGQVDLMHHTTAGELSLIQKVIRDAKVTSVWSMIYDPNGREEWHEQLNFYRYLWLLNGEETHQLKVDVLLRDWHERNAQKDKDYPQTPVIEIDIPVWEDEVVKQRIEELVLEHAMVKSPETVADDELPFCTDRQMWLKGAKTALMNKHKKAAVKLFDSREEAGRYIANIPIDRGYYLQDRPGRRQRCESYCQVNMFCNQYRQYRDEIDNAKEG